MSKTAIIIPARYGSSRLEGKPLIEVAGKTIIQWVYEKAQMSKLADMIIVATDDERIFNTVKAFGGNVEMTSTSHKCGSDRIREVVDRHPEIDYIVNLQGDEPLIEPSAAGKPGIRRACRTGIYWNSPPQGWTAGADVL